jgi:hypothetical protein
LPLLRLELSIFPDTPSISLVHCCFQHAFQVSPSPKCALVTHRRGSA